MSENMDGYGFLHIICINQKRTDGGDTLSVIQCLL